MLLLSENMNIIDCTPEENDNLTNLYSENYKSFVEMMAPVMAQIVIWRRDNVKVHLNNLKLDNLFRFTNGKIEPKLGAETKQGRVNIAAQDLQVDPSDEDALQTMEATFRQFNGPSNLTRGKYLLWFLSEAVNSCHQTIMQHVNTYQHAPKIRQPIGAKTLILSAAPRARIPLSLRNFIERTYLAHVGLAEAA